MFPRTTMSPSPAPAVLPRTDAFGSELANVEPGPSHGGQSNPINHDSTEVNAPPVYLFVEYPSASPDPRKSEQKKQLCVAAANEWHINRECADQVTEAAMAEHGRRQLIADRNEQGNWQLTTCRKMLLIAGLGLAANAIGIGTIYSIRFSNGNYNFP